MTATPQPANIPNRITMDVLVQRAQELGEQAGKGKDTQIKMLLSIVDGAFQGAITDEKDKHGADIDDCRKLAETYVKAQNSATRFDGTQNKYQKLLSTFKTCRKLGAWTGGGVGEPMATVQKLMNTWQTKRNDPTFDKKRLKDAANSLIDFARAQVRRDTLIDGAELEQFCHKKTADPATAEEVLDAARKKINNLVKGSNGVQDNSPKVRQALDLLNSRMVDVANAKRGTTP